MKAREENLKRLFDDGLVRRARAVLSGSGTTYLCGACVADALLGTEPGNLLVACAGDSGRVARALAAACGFSTVRLAGSEGAFNLAERRRGGRCVTVVPVLKDINTHISLAPFTVSAMAADMSGEQPRLIDPSGGLSDLDAGRLVVSYGRRG